MATAATHPYSDSDRFLYGCSVVCSARGTSRAERRQSSCRRGRPALRGSSREGRVSWGNSEVLLLPRKSPAQPFRLEGKGGEPPHASHHSQPRVAPPGSSSDQRGGGSLSPSGTEPTLFPPATAPPRGSRLHTPAALGLLSRVVLGDHLRTERPPLPQALSLIHVARIPPRRDSQETRLPAAAAQACSPLPWSPALSPCSANGRPRAPPPSLRSTNGRRRGRPRPLSCPTDCRSAAPPRPQGRSNERCRTPLALPRPPNRCP